MHSDFYQRLTELQATEEPFAVATVIRVHGSASAKPGSKQGLVRQADHNSGGVGRNLPQPGLERTAHPFSEMGMVHQGQGARLRRESCAG